MQMPLKISERRIQLCWQKSNLLYSYLISNHIFLGAYAFPQMPCRITVRITMLSLFVYITHQDILCHFELVCIDKKVLFKHIIMQSVCVPPL